MLLLQFFRPVGQPRPLVVVVVVLVVDLDNMISELD